MLVRFIFERLLQQRLLALHTGSGSPGCHGPATSTASCTPARCRRRRSRSCMGQFNFRYEDGEQAASDDRASIHANQKTESCQLHQNYSRKHGVAYTRSAAFPSNYNTCYTGSFNIWLHSKPQLKNQGVLQLPFPEALSGSCHRPAEHLPTAEGSWLWGRQVSQTCKGLHQGP